MIYYQLLLEGVYVWEGRNCFLSEAHDEKVIEQLEEKIKNSCQQLVRKGIIKQKTPV
jgi:glutamate-1-semialdehyde aminotransferase